MSKEEDKKGLKELSSVIQVCKVCGKIDAYKDDGHDCDNYIASSINREMREG